MAGQDRREKRWRWTLGARRGLGRSAARLLVCLSPLALFPGALVGGTLGCSNCPPPKPIDDFRGGHVYPSGYYETNTLREEMLPFPAGGAYRIEHHLGRLPLLVMPYLSFVARPDLETQEDGVGNFTLASGNLALIEHADEEVVVVRNDTCADFYLRVVVETDGLGGQGGSP
jgi:hypothetical protein